MVRCDELSVLPAVPSMLRRVLLSRTIRLASGLTCALAAGWSAPADAPLAAPAIVDSSACDNSGRTCGWAASRTKVEPP
eukprot:1795458-Prymnesium_polylepis.1